ncbi:MAG: S8 family serine peptidase [Bacteroidia bacterium]
MKESIFLLVFLLVQSDLFSQVSFHPDKTDPALIAAIAERPDDFHPVYILLEDHLDMVAMNNAFNKQNTSLEDRSVIAINALKSKAAATQGPLLNWLGRSEGVVKESVQSFWITNVIYAEIRGEAVHQLGQREDVGQIELVVPPRVETTSNRKKVPARPAGSVGGHEPGHNVIHAPEMWALGYSGAGRKILVIDSGVDGQHPALKDNYHGNFVPGSQTWYAPASVPEPADCFTIDHGTNVAGIAVGLDRVTHDTIGVAYNSTWMGAMAISHDDCNNVVNVVNVFQWAMDPDGNPATIDDRPDVINDSWGSVSVIADPLYCYATIPLIINSLEAAGIGVIAGAGNEGVSNPPSIIFPAYANFSLVDAFAVGAIDGNNPNLPLASFSSQGPSICGDTGSLLIKPEVVAPGVNIRTSTSFGYIVVSGTSMSAPLASGAFLLLKEAFPSLTGEQIKLGLYYGASDLGPPGEDNKFGMGVVDVMGAYNYLISQGNTPATPALDKDAMLLSAEPNGQGLCDSVAVPELVIRNSGRTTFTTLEIAYQISNGTSGTYTWTGSLAPGLSQTIQMPMLSLEKGYYSIKYVISKVDGIKDRLIFGNLNACSFALLGDEKPISPSPVNICYASKGLLTASSPSPDVILKWYDTQGSANVLGEGPNFMTILLTVNRDYYVGAVTEFNLGLENKDVGSGTFLPQTTNYLTFDVNYPVLLNSVKVYASVAGTRTIQVKNSSGTVIGSKTVSVTPQISGGERIDLNISLAPGKGYRMELDGSLAFLHANTSGFTFPMDFRGMISITGSNNGLYNYFYDWELEYKSPCGRTRVQTIVSNGSATAGFTSSDTVIDISNAAQVHFTNTSTGAARYLWSFGDGTTSTQVNPSHHYYTAGFYQVGLAAISSDSCSDAVAMNIHVTGVYPYNVGIEEDIEEFGKVSIYPNPGTGLYNLVLDLNRKHEAEIEIFDQVGKKITFLEKNEYQRNHLLLDISGYSSGIYYLKIRTLDQTIVKKLIKIARL